MDENLEKKYRQIKNLSQYKGKTEKEKLEIAKKLLEEEEILGSLTFCVNKEEQTFANNLLNRYLSQSLIEGEADKDTLRQLIDLEVLAERIKSILKTEYNKANPAIPLQMVEQLRETEKEILNVKEKLGLTTKDKSESSVDKIIGDLTERFEKFINRPENRSNYECQCPDCKEMILIRRRIDKEKDEVVKHPWFIEGGVLMNREIFKDLELGKISEDQVARYLNATLDYIKWLRINYPLNQDKEEEQEENV